MHIFFFCIRKNAWRCVRGRGRGGADTLQAQGHLEKDFALSRDSRAELRGYPARAANSAPKAAQVSARRKASERRGFIRNLEGVIRWKRRALSRACDFYP